MSIVNQRLVQDPYEYHGQTILRLEFTDHLGEKHRFRRVCSIDPNAFLLAHVPKVEALLSKDELRGVVKRVDNGEDSLVVALNPIHSTTKEIAKTLIYHMVKARDIGFVLKMEPLIEYIKANFTSNQMQNFLDVTAQQLTRMNIKYNSVISNKADLLAADFSEEF